MPPLSPLDYGVNWPKALIIGECAAAGARLDQITKIFAASGFTVLTVSELDARA
jgi:hypothetical protein